MPSTRAQAQSEKHDAQSMARNTTTRDDPTVWCLAELERAGDMHPDAYKHAPQPKGHKTVTKDSINPRKRKDSIRDSSYSPAKAARRSSPSPSSQAPETEPQSADASRDGKKGESTDGTPAPAPLQTLRFLLSPRALPLAVPAAERAQDSSVRTYATARLTPFEELLAAVVLSRPISHALGQRAVRTLLNPPYALTTPGRVVEGAAEGRVRDALWEARTQHKEKTAEEVGGLAETVVERWGGGGGGGGEGDDGSLEGVREEAGWEWQREREVLKGAVKGLGETGLDVFGRRVQWLWREIFPFVDGRTKGALEELGLPGDAEELRKLMEREWEGLGVRDIGLKDEEEKKRRAFVIVLERAVGASLEKKVHEVVREAAKE